LKFKPGRWELGKLGMGTSGSVFANEFKTPVVGYGPGSETYAHAADEAVELSKLSEVSYGTACIAHSIVGVPVFGWTSEDI
jgi:acetylornithine deacetylase/succinyl-diaminopimelate desuccinylase-like protein